MDISPLPHKLPVNSYLQSPTPEPTPSTGLSSMLGSPSISEFLQEPQALTLQMKKKIVPLRPGLMKGHTISEIPRRPSVESQLPPFQFGNGISQQTVASSLSLSEAFESSPPAAKTHSRNLSAMAPPRFHPFSNAVPNIRGGGGSPMGNHARKMSNPPVRPRKQARRSHSMFENPGVVILQQNVSPPLDSIMDVEHQVPQLPHFTKDAEGVPRITGETMIDVLDGKYTHVHDKVIVIDCRFDFEYNGGHINGALSFDDKEKLAAHMFDCASPLSTSRSLVIFHCEYSVHRAPIMAQFFRSHDRSVNPERYPTLTYPEAYVLDGGYKSFFRTYRSRCVGTYVEMNAPKHAEDCEKGMGKVKKQRLKFGRSHTFAGFGHDSSPIGSSPIGLRNNLHRHASDTIWSPVALDRGGVRNPSDSTMEATASSDISMGLSDSDIDMDTTTDLPTFKQPSFGRPFEAGRTSPRRMFSSFN
jgi:M-phase inducer tyrosine phosphatase